MCSFILNVVSADYFMRENINARVQLVSPFLFRIRIVVRHLQATISLKSAQAHKHQGGIDSEYLHTCTATYEYTKGDTIPRAKVPGTRGAGCVERNPYCLCICCPGSRIQRYFVLRTLNTKKVHHELLLTWYTSSQRAAMRRPHSLLRLATRPVLLQNRLSIPAPSIRTIVVLGIETSADDTCAALFRVEGQGTNRVAYSLCDDRISCANTQYRGIHPAEAVVSHTRK